MKQINKYRLVLFLRYLGDSFFLSFFSLYLISLDIVGSRLGFALAVLQATSIIFNPLWGLVTKNINLNVKIASWMVLFEAFAVLVFWQFISFEIIVIIIFCIGIVSSPYQSIQEGIIGSYCGENNYDFATVRIFGSIAYVISTALGGFIITYFGFKIIFIITTILYIIVFSLWRTIKPVETIEEIKPKKGSFKSVLLNRNFIIYLITFIFGVGSLSVGDNYFGVYLDSREIGITTIGLVTSAVIFIEVIVVNIVMKSKIKQNYRLLITASLIFVFIRNFSFSFDPSLAYLLIFSISKGLGWGTIVSVHLNYLVKTVKRENLTYAIMLLTSVYSLFVSLMNYLVGNIYINYGFKKVYLILSVLTFISILISLFLKENNESETLEEKEKPLLIQG